MIHGNLLTLPVGESFLYVEPLYVQATAQNNGASRSCTRPGRLWRQDRLRGQPARRAGQPQPGAGGHLVDQWCEHDADRHSAPELDRVAIRQRDEHTHRLDHAAEPDSAVLLKQVDQAFADLQAAYASGDPARVGVAEARLKALSWRSTSG